MTSVRAAVLSLSILLGVDVFSRQIFTYYFIGKKIFEFANKTGISIGSFIRIFVLNSSCVS